MSSQFATMSSQLLLAGDHSVARRVKSIWSDFWDFLARDNVLEVALGLIIANGFTDIVKSLVSDIILPPIALLPFINRNLHEKFFVLRTGPNYPYNTLKQAAEDGAVTMAWGSFVDNIVSFIALGVVLYLLAQAWGLLTKESIIRHTKRCKYCRKDISEKAQRCAFCTSWQDGREDRETSALQGS